MSEDNNNTSSNEDVSEISVTEVLQAHDILISILIGNVLASSQNPLLLITQMKKIVAVQEVDEKVKGHINLMLDPLEESLQGEQK